MKPRQFLDYLAILVRWRAWYDSKLPLFLAALFYALLRNQLPITTLQTEAIVMFILLCLYASFGFMINDFSDFRIDRAAGKTRLLSTWKKPQILGTLILLAASIIMIPILVFDIATTGVCLFSVVLAYFYSMPPVRLKERGLMGWLSATIAQRTLPLIIIFQGLGVWDLAAVLMCILSTAIGLRFIARHQLNDFENDTHTGVQTLATMFGKEKTEKLVNRVLFPMEITSAIATVVIISLSFPSIIILSIGYLVAWYVVYLKQGSKANLLTHRVLGDLYYTLWPITLAVLLTLEDTFFIIYVFISIALQNRRIKELVTYFSGGTSQDKVEPLQQVPTTVSTSNVTDDPGKQKKIPGMKKSNPYPQYAYLRSQGPVHNINWPQLGPIWTVVRYKEAVSLMDNPGFKKESRIHNKVNLDPSAQLRLQTLVSKAIAPGRVEGTTGKIQQMVNARFDKAASRGKIEFMSKFATLIPLAIFLDLLGLQVDNITNFRALMLTLGYSKAVGIKTDTLETQEQEFTKYIQSIIEARKSDPRDDLVTALVQVEHEGDRLASDEITAIIYLLLLRDYLATVNLIGNGVYSLIRNPEQMELLRKQPDLIDACIEEILRFESPVELSSAYLATTDTTFSNVQLPRNSRLYIVVPSVNHDEQQFQDADVFDITRTDCRHLSLERGIHDCIGTPLIRLIARVSLLTLVERFPGIALAVPLEQVKWLKHPVKRGIQSLPLIL